MRTDYHSTNNSGWPDGRNTVWPFLSRDGMETAEAWLLKVGWLQAFARLAKAVFGRQVGEWSTE